jgi:geranylgeranyl diphosphate synthase type I
MLENELRKRKELVESALKEIIHKGKPEELYEASIHLLKAGGKRLRPVTVLLTAELVGGKSEDAISAAIAVELLHNFTLIHDDIMDEDEMRRGIPTVHSLWGVPYAILAGDTLHALSFEILSSSRAPPERVVRAVEILSKACVEICEGQWMDMEFEKRENVSEDEYLEMVGKKTGALYEASAMLGGVIGGGEEEEIKALGSYGRNVGIGFQIYDDILDLIGKGEEIGKDRGSDIAEGKKTMLVIRARELGVELPEVRKRDEDSVEEIVEILKNFGIMDYAIRRAEEYVERGKKALEIFPDCKTKKILLELADFMIKRSY